MKASNINEYFGTLQQTVVGSWRKHLKADNNDIHVILNDYYDDVIDLVDTLIEDYMGIYDKIESYENVFKEEEYDVIEYFEELREFTKSGKDLFEEDELISDIDDILSLIDSTLYKLKNLTNAKEGRVRSLKDFLTESLK